MNFFVVYSIVFIMVTTTSGENKVKQALVGVPELSVRYTLEVMIRTRDAGFTNENIHGSIDVSANAVVEYKDQMGLIVTAAKLLQGVDEAEKLKFPDLKAEVISTMRVDSIELPGNNSPQKKFASDVCYPNHVYLVDVSGIQGVAEFQTYKLEANHKILSLPTRFGTCTIVHYEGKLCARVYFPGAKNYKFEIFREGDSKKFPITFEEQNPSGLIVVKMAAD